MTPTKHTGRETNSGRSTPVRSLTDHELRATLKDHGISPGPITDSTRELYVKKLESILDKIEEEESDNGTQDEDLESEETSDESFEVDEEELNESSDSYSEEVEEFDEDEELDDEELADGMQAKQTTSKSKFYFVLLFSLLVIAASIYLYANNNNLKIYKNLTRQLIILLALSPIGYILYKLYRLYVVKRDEENKRVCELVSQALALLQSPENPKGLMPILHIRDTLLTPAERKAKKSIKLWQKAVKFIEEHESRVKVELVNIDSEDFRAWKWIGSRKVI